MKDTLNQKQKYLDYLCELFFINQLEIIEIKEFTKTFNDNGQGYKTQRNALMFPLHGEATIKVSNQTFLASKGKLIYICKNQHLNIIVNSAYTYINIYLNNGPLQSFELLQHNQKILQTVTKLCKICQHEETLHRYFLKIQYLSMIFHAISNSENKGFLDKISLIKTIETYIQNHLHERIRMEDIETIANLNIDKVNYIFKKYKHISIHHYIIEVKMKKAIQLLGIEGYSVKDTAFYLGYDDPLYFSRLFKKKVGFQPSQLKPTQISD